MVPERGNERSRCHLYSLCSDIEAKVDSDIEKFQCTVDLVIVLFLLSIPWQYDLEGIASQWRSFLASP